MGECTQSRCPTCGKEIGEASHYHRRGCPPGYHLDAIILSRLFGQVEAKGTNTVHRLAQERLYKMGRDLGFMAVLEYQEPDLVKNGRKNYIDVVWKSQKGIAAAFEVRRKRQDLDIVTTRKDRMKLECLMAGAKFIVNVSETTGKAYFHKMVDSPIAGALSSEPCHTRQQPTSIPERERDKAYSVEHVRQKHPQAYRKWTPEEDAALAKQYREGNSIAHLAKLHQRKKGAIRSRLVRLGVIEGPSLAQGVFRRNRT